MRYEVYGIYSKESGSNCILAARRSYKQAAEYIQNCGHTQFVEYFILEKATKHSFPYSYTFFDAHGYAYKAGIMAATLKPAFWQSETYYKEFNQLRKGI